MCIFSVSSPTSRRPSSLTPEFPVRGRLDSMESPGSRLFEGSELKGASRSVLSVMTVAGTVKGISMRGLRTPGERKEPKNSREMGYDNITSFIEIILTDLHFSGFALIFSFQVGIVHRRKFLLYSPNICPCIRVRESMFPVLQRPGLPSPCSA
ncbi:hypothetical protein BCR34DRAFT_168597 [Clohesyomyces aquaticus]|uniref:Uncharacterized protein n=1 Tax=Clohesyomyces aquaticus TaxID=1231657 RepID=A0A1Y1YGR2_9PLEO|nr:hypothetical protein BCR34DRAFT_168597 [Clohesyomyces aquaticus]